MSNGNGEKDQTKEETIDKPLSEGTQITIAFGVICILLGYFSPLFNYSSIDILLTWLSASFFMIIIVLISFIQKLRQYILKEEFAQLFFIFLLGSLFFFVVFNSFSGNLGMVADNAFFKSFIVSTFLSLIVCL